MALDQEAIKEPLTPEWWMVQLAAILNDTNRVNRIGTLAAYRAGCPPLPWMPSNQRKGFYRFQRVSRTGLAKPVVTSRVKRMAVRAIRTAAASDANGDALAWSHWTRNRLSVVGKDVHDDMFTFGEAIVKVGLDGDGQPTAIRRDPRTCITVQDPMNPVRTIAAFELVWDEWAGMDYAYLALPGAEYVAEHRREGRPPAMPIRGLSAADLRSVSAWKFWPRIGFNAADFTMRPVSSDAIDPEDGRPNSQTFTEKVVPYVSFRNTRGQGEFEEHLDHIDRIHQLITNKVLTSAMQLFKQRALEQEAAKSDGTDVDRLPDVDPQTKKPIPWEELFEPGPDALWKLPPGVKIWESAPIDMNGILADIKSEIMQYFALTGTPSQSFSDDVNASAQASDNRHEDIVFAVEDAEAIAGGAWGEVVSLMFRFGPDDERADAGGADRAEVGKIVLSWAPVERYSLIDRASADSTNKTLSPQMAAAKIWDLSPDEVAINETQRQAALVAQQITALAATAGQPKPAPATPPAATPPAGDGSTAA